MIHASSSPFDTAIPYVFSMCGAPGDGWNPPVVAMAMSRLSSFRSEEWCPLERSNWQVVLFTLGATWHFPLTFEKALQHTCHLDGLL
jgi:hypothetical protein